MSKHVFRVTLAAIALALGITGANAGTAVATLNVTATIGTSCVIAPATLNFGTAPSAANLSIYTSTNISVTCSSGSAYSIDLSAGQNYGGQSAAPNARGMSDGQGHIMAYQLYQDAAHTVVWGSPLPGGIAMSGTGNGSTQSYTLYGGGGQVTPLPGGTYSDTVTMTVSY